MTSAFLGTLGSYSVIQKAGGLAGSRPPVPGRLAWHGVVGNALIIDHAGLYLLILLVFPVGFVMLMFEERDLVNRFGEDYLQYQREVPQIIPRWSGPK